jgi:hypothetical protein
MGAALSPEAGRHCPAIFILAFSLPAQERAMPATEAGNAPAIAATALPARPWTFGNLLPVAVAG